jgi:hypothetical protein
MVSNLADFLQFPKDKYSKCFGILVIYSYPIGYYSNIKEETYYFSV